MCGCQSSGSDAEPVITTLSAPLASSSLAQLGPQRHDRVVQLDADAPAHADDHRLAVHRREALLEVRDEVARDEREALLGADHRLELRPLAS